MTIRVYEEMINFKIVELRNDDIVLGIPWLKKHNPAIY